MPQAKLHNVALCLHKWRIITLCKIAALPKPVLSEAEGPKTKKKNQKKLRARWNHAGRDTAMPHKSPRTPVFAGKTDATRLKKTPHFWAMVWHLKCNPLFYRLLNLKKCHKMCHNGMFYGRGAPWSLGHHFKKLKIAQRPKSHSFKSSSF